MLAVVCLLGVALPVLVGGKVYNMLQAVMTAKVLFILGAKDAMPLVEQLPDFEAVWVDADNRVIASSGLKDRVKMLHEPTPGP